MRAPAIGLAILLILPTAAFAQQGRQVLDLFLQGAQQELYRQQQRQVERQQRQELDRLYQQFVAEWQTCHSGDLAACNRALSYPYINGNDRDALIRRRSQIVSVEQEAAERVRRQRIEADAEAGRQQALAAQQRQYAEEQHRIRLERQLKELLEEQERQKIAASQWSQTVLSGVLALVIAVAGILGFVFRGTIKSAWTKVIANMRGGGSDHRPAEPTNAKPATPEQPAVSTTPRDTAGALAAMELAFAYIQEVHERKAPALDDKDERRHQLNTLALASKQLDLAARLDANAILEGENDGAAFRIGINELKAEALLLEGITHQFYDMRRAIPALVAATTFNPNNAHAFFVLGMVYAANLRKAQAVAAFEQAVALEPGNIAYRKELARAQNLSGAEVASYRALRAGERLVDGAALTWNVFALICNVLTFPLRITLALFRLLRLHPFV